VTIAVRLKMNLEIGVSLTLCFIQIFIRI